MFSSSLGKKYLMALTGIVLIGFVFVHMAGNLQVLLGQDKINAYAHALAVAAHADTVGVPPLPAWYVSSSTRWTAIMYSSGRIGPRAPRGNDVEVTKRAGLSSLKMGLSGTILLFFIVFHLLLHSTVRTVYPEYNDMMTTRSGAPEGRGSARCLHHGYWPVSNISGFLFFTSSPCFYCAGT